MPDYDQTTDPAVPPPPAPGGDSPIVHRGSFSVGILVFAVLVLLGWLLYARTGSGGDQPYQLWGLYAVAVLFAIATVFSGRFWPSKLVEGEDGRLSVSKTQVAVWTATIAYSYVTLYAARAFQAHELQPIESVPHNVLIVLGISAASAVGAKAITVSKISTNRIQKTDKPPGSASLADLVSGDDRCPDLNKVQLLFWTLVSVIVYVVLTNGALAHYFASLNCTGPAAAGGHDINCLALPNIDTVLMVLMGLSHGTYLGGKMTQADLPRITSMTPLSGPPGTMVVLLGIDLGTVVGSIFLDNRPYWGPTASIVWTDTKICFPWPANDATGAPWAPGRAVAITVMTYGQSVQGAASFMVTHA